MAITANKMSLEPLKRQWEAFSGRGAKYERLAEVFAACIQSGRYEVGALIPKETEICAALPVGLSTVQKALGKLVDEGFIVRRRGLGSFIADPKGQVPEVHVYRFRDHVTGDVMMPFTRVLGMRTVKTAEYGSLLLEFDAEHVVRIDRLVWVTGSQPAYSSFFMRTEHSIDLPEGPDVLHGASYHRLLWEEFGIRVATVRHSACAELLSRQACEEMNLAAPHVGMLWDAHEFDREGILQLLQRFELPRGHRPMELVEGKLGR